MIDPERYVSAEKGNVKEERKDDEDMKNEQGYGHLGMGGKVSLEWYSELVTRHEWFEILCIVADNLLHGRLLCLWIQI